MFLFLCVLCSVPGDRLTSEIFYYQRTNVYSIVTDLSLIRGQTVSNALEVQFPASLAIAAPFEVCIGTSAPLVVFVLMY
jgi:hypothetical protein